MADKKIMIIDDEQGVIDVLTPALENHGYQVLSANDGLEGFRRVLNDEPDLVLLDVKMPKVDGYHLCYMIKRDKKIMHIPVIMLTAKTQEADILKGKKSGADDYIIKPFNIKNVLETIGKFL